MNTRVPDNPFPDELIAEIARVIKATDAEKRRWLMKHLHALPDDIRHYESARVIQKPSEVRDDLYSVKSACDKLLTSLGATRKTGALDLSAKTIATPASLILWQIAARIDAANPTEAVLDGRGRRRFQTFVNSLVKLRDAASNAAENVARDIKKGRGGSRYEGDPVLDDVMLDLIQLYEEVTDKKGKPWVNPRTKKPNGLFIRYIKLCLGALGWNLSPQAIRSRYRRLDRNP